MSSLIYQTNTCKPNFGDLPIESNGEFCKLEIVSPPFQNTFTSISEQHQNPFMSISGSFPSIIPSPARNTSAQNSPAETETESASHQRIRSQDLLISQPENLPGRKPESSSISAENQCDVVQLVPQESLPSATRLEANNLQSTGCHLYPKVEQSDCTRKMDSTPSAIFCEKSPTSAPTPQQPGGHSEFYEKYSGNASARRSAGAEVIELRSSYTHPPPDLFALPHVESYCSIAEQSVSVSRQVSVRGSTLVQYSPGPGAHSQVVVGQSSTLTPLGTATAQIYRIRPHPLIPLVLGVISSLCCFWCCGVPSIVLSLMALKRWGNGRKARHLSAFTRPSFSQSLSSTSQTVAQPSLSNTNGARPNSVSAHSLPYSLQATADSGPAPCHVAQCPAPTAHLQRAPPVESVLHAWSIARERTRIQLLARVALVLALLGLACAALNLGFWLWFGMAGRHLFSTSSSAVSTGRSTTEGSSSAGSCEYSTSVTSQQYYCYLHRAPGTAGGSLTCCCRLRGGEPSSLGCIINGTPAAYSVCGIQCGM